MSAAAVSAAAEAAGTVVVGAGVAGLTIAHELARRGEPVTVVERNERVGGLARSFRYGDWSFDIGPHRFHTDDPEVRTFVRAVLGDEATEVPRRSGVHAFGKTHDWPLRPRVLASLPLRTMFRGIQDLVRRERVPGDTFEAHIVSRYGRTLYDSFFRRYTERFLGVPAERVHRDWAQASVDRAVVDPRARPQRDRRLFESARFPEPAAATFIYPTGGIGRFSERLASAVAAHGGRLLLGRPVSILETAGDRVTALVAGDERIPAERVVWTAPLTEARRLLGADGTEPGLRFLSTIVYNVMLKEPSSLGYQWVCYGDEERFVRVSDPTAFSPAAAPAGKGSLCVECTCREGDPLWEDPYSHIASVLVGLALTRAIRSVRSVEAVHAERIPDTYPVYTMEYRDAQRRNIAALARHENLVLAGRCGLFWYNNMDHSIAQGLRIAEQLAAGHVPSEAGRGDLEAQLPTPAPGVDEQGSTASRTAKGA